MKRVILFMGLVFMFCLPVFSQVYVDDVNINELDITYCEIVAKKKFLSEKVKIIVDYGQPRRELGSAKIKDKDGKVIAFMGVVGALNFMEKNGWEYMESLLLTHDDNIVYHFWLKKKK